MASIVVELQRDSLNPEVDVSDLLRKALVIASKLGIRDLNSWIENELGGYRDSKAVPLYRIVTGEVMGQDAWGQWVSVLFRQNDMFEMVSTVRLFDSVAELEGVLQRAGPQQESNLSIGLSPEQDAILARLVGSGPTKFARFIRLEDVKGALDAVRTEILKWALKLEKDGILGEGVSFSKDEQRKAAAVHYTTNFYGSVGNISQHGRQFSQTASVGIHHQDLTKLVKDLSEHLDDLNLDARQKQRAEAQIATINAELTGEPDSVIVGQAARSLRSITEGAIGNLLATAGTNPSVWHWIHQMLVALSANAT